TSLVADMVPAQVRGQYFGFRNTLLWAITSFGLFIGGYILEQVPGLNGYHILFTIIAIGAALNVAAMFLYPKVPFEKSPSPNLRLMISKPFQNTVFAKSMSFITGWQFLQTLVVPLFSYIMLSVMGLGEYVVSMLTIVQTVSMMLSYYFWGRLNARIPARK